jgi:hypothetical protein
MLNNNFIRTIKEVLEMARKKQMVMKRECIEVRTTADTDISVQVDSKANYPYEAYNPISTTFGASGSLIVHGCNQIFMRESLIESVETIESPDGTKYQIIHFKKLKVE